MEQNKQPDLRILFIGKAGDFFSRQAADFILVHYPLANIIYSERNQPFPPELERRSYNFLSLPMDHSSIAFTKCFTGGSKFSSRSAGISWYWLY
jgi:hypothetical protein